MLNIYVIFDAICTRLQQKAGSVIGLYVARSLGSLRAHVNDNMLQKRVSIQPAVRLLALA